MKLIKCSDYVIEVASVKMESGETVGGQIIKEYYSLVDYSNFLKRPLELGMFIPTDKEGNVLGEPEVMTFICVESQSEYLKQYQEAKDRVLFKGCVYNDYQPSTKFNDWTINGFVIARETNGGVAIKHLTIEDLCELGLELTESAIKQLKV